MKAFKLLSNTALVFSLALLASCSSNDDLEPVSDVKPASNKVVEFTANLGSSETAVDSSKDTLNLSKATRATLESNNDVHWDLGDRLYVFCDNYEYAGLFSITPSSIDGKTAKFTNFENELPNGFEAKEFYYALYPFGAATFNINTSMITSVLTANQKVTEGCTYDKNALVMVACADCNDKTFNFKNIPALIKINVSNNADGKVKYIKIAAKNTANRLSGNFRASVNYLTDQLVLETSSDADSRNTVRLQIPATDESKDFYIAALPGNLNNGFTIIFEDEKGNAVYERTTKKGASADLKSSKIYPFGSYDVAKFPTKE